MRILIIHQNFPGQFRHIAGFLAKQPGIQVIGLGREFAPGMPEVQWFKYKLHRSPRKEQHHYLRQMENAILHGQAIVRALFEFKKRGFTPDIILAHPGWGETLYAKEVFPDAKLVHFCEWYYGTDGSDVAFDPEFPASFDDRARIKTWNALHTLNLENCDAGITPTQWQLSRHPDIYRKKISLIHEGINTDYLGPDPGATLTVPGGAVLKNGDPIITYVARNLEPYRGFHSFIRALEIIQRKNKNCHTVIIGGDDVSYGRPPSNAPNWREKMLREVQLDPSRTHFLGKVPYNLYLKALQISVVHIYLTYPFVLSWSMLEAMACGCLVIGSRTAPVEEVIRDNENGLLVDFFDKEEIAGQALKALQKPGQCIELRKAAQSEIQERFSVRSGLAGYQALLSEGEILY